MDDDLPEKYRLHYWLGMIVQNDVFAESEMGMLWRALHQAGLPVDDFQRDFGRLIPVVRRGLKLAQIPNEFRSIASDVLEATHRAHRVRRELAHDLLMLDHRDSSVVRSMRSAFPPRPMSELESCANDLMTLTWRLRATGIIAPFWIGGPKDGYETEEIIRSWTRVAMGHISDEHPNAIVGTLGPWPEPPGGFA